MTTARDKFFVIGAGLPRTGTKSLMHALELLLSGKCHHGMKAYQHANDWCRIMNAINDEKSNNNKINEDIKTVLLQNNYVASVDLPSAVYFDRLLEIFPDAVVILTDRRPEAWVESMQKTVAVSSYWSYNLVYVLSFLCPKYITKMARDDEFRIWSTKMVKAGLSSNRIGNIFRALSSGRGVEFYNEWKEFVKSKVPTEKLLIYDVKEGWEPLCNHLEIEVPDIPFPNCNSSFELEMYLLRNKRRAWLILYEIISIPLLCFGLYVITRVKNLI